MREAIAGRFVGAKVQRGRGPAPAHRRGPLRRRHRRARHAARRVRAQPAPARVDPRASTSMPRVVCPAWWRCSRAPTSRSSRTRSSACCPLPGLYNPVHYALATDRVRLVGDPVAMVVATSRYVAEDAAELVSRRLRTARADRHHRPGARPAPTADLAGRTRQRDVRSHRRVRRPRPRVPRPPTG